MRKREKGIVVDIGTGDGKFVYELAKQNPNTLFIGIDTNRNNVVKTSLKTIKKKSRGGVKNALFVPASISQLPEELYERANQVFINFPWGSLLHAIATADENALQEVCKIMKNGASLDIIFGYDVHTDTSEIQRLQLPDLTEAYLNAELIPGFELLGFTNTKCIHLNTGKLQNYPSTWAKKLRERTNRTYYYLQFEKTSAT